MNSFDPRIATAPSLKPIDNSHGQQSAAQGSSTTVSRSVIQLIQHLDSSAHGLVRRRRLIGCFLILTPLFYHQVAEACTARALRSQTLRPRVRAELTRHHRTVR
jgi:hypothetical protein